MQRNNFYIITGGPGSGKTTLIEALKAQGFLCVEETGRRIIQEQIRIGGDALHWKDQIKFRELMLTASIQDFKRIAENQRPVFSDRGIPDLIGYSRLIKAEAPKYLKEAVGEFRYNPKVFVASPWKEIYRNDEERKQTYEEAVLTYQAVTEGYVASGYRLVEIPKSTVRERADFLLKHCNYKP